MKNYAFLCFAKNMGKNIGKKANKNLSGKSNLKFLGHAKLSASDELKTA